MTEIKEQFSRNGPFKAPATGKGSFLVRVIAPGRSLNRRWYRSALLKERAALVKPGTPMFLDHRNGARSVHDLAAVVVEGGKYDPAGPWGPGIYCRARPITTKKDLLRQMETAIGVSIVADGTTAPCPTHPGDDLVETIDAFKSIDFVTVPAAGGKYACPLRSPTPAPTKPDVARYVQYLEKNRRVHEHLVTVAALHTGTIEAAQEHVNEIYGPPPTSANRYYAALQESTAARLALRTDPATATRQAAEHVAATRQRQRARMNQAFAAIAPTLEDVP